MTKAERVFGSMAGWNKCWQCQQPVENLTEREMRKDHPGGGYACIMWRACDDCLSIDVSYDDAWNFSSMAGGRLHKIGLKAKIAK